MSNHKNHIEQIYIESCYFACLNNRILIMHNKFIANFFVSNSSAIWIIVVSLCGGWLTQNSLTVYSVTVWRLPTGPHRWSLLNHGLSWLYGLWGLLSYSIIVYHHLMGWLRLLAYSIMVG